MTRPEQTSDGRRHSFHEVQRFTEAPEHLFTVNGALRPGIPLPRRTSILAHCERFTRPIRRSTSGCRAARDCCTGWYAAFLSRSDAACRNGQAHPGAGPRDEWKPLSPDQGLEPERRYEHVVSIQVRMETPNPAMVLADLVDVAQPHQEISNASPRLPAPLYKPVSLTTITRIEKSPSDFVVTFTEDKKGFLHQRQEVWSVGIPHDERIHRRLPPLGGGE